MKLAIIDTLGLSYDGSTLHKRGLGGSESAVILMAKELVNIGFEVTVFNDCISDESRPGVYKGVTYAPLKDVETNNLFDVMIGSRSVASFAPSEMIQRFKSFTPLPDFTAIHRNSRWKALWVHDTFCDGDDLIEDFILHGRINELFTLSDFHTSYVANCDHGKRRNFEVLKNHIFQTRNGIKKHINWVDVTQKNPNQFVYNASVTKGMIPLVEKIWPKIKQQIPDAKLTVIGGYYRFRSDHQPDAQEQRWHDMVQYHGNDIEFTGIITQKEIASRLANASFMIYPAAFPETFGISTLESLAYNTPLITCQFGALEETAIDVACYKIPYAIEPNGLFPWINTDYQVDRFVEVTVAAYHNKYLHQQKMYACNQIKDICGWDSVALQWKQHLYKKLGSFLPIDEYRKVTKINHDVRKIFGRKFYNLEELQEPRQDQQNIMIVTPVYNAENYIRNCILSVAQQDYDNYTMYIIDDASTDNTLNVIYSTLDEIRHNRRPNTYFEVIENKTNQGAVRNQICTITADEYNPGDSIVMLLDGDDWLINDPNIFHKYNNLYHAGAEFTYGSCYSLVDNIPLIAQPYPPEVKANKSYRDYKFNWNMPYTHLRTFKKALLNQLDHSVFQDSDGNWLRAGGDTAVFYNILEQAVPDNVICIPDIVYNYNDVNPLNDYKVNGTEQTKTANGVINKNKVKEKFSIIIPTMWRCKEVFAKALQKYIDHDLVNEIIIINNDVNETPNWLGLDNSKIRMYNQESNIMVNQAWNLGVSLSNNNLLAIINDDIQFDTKLFDKIHDRITPKAGVHGIITGEAIFNHPLTTDKSIDFIQWNQGDNIHGFGQAMFIHKSNWVPIVNGLNIYFGDDFIFHSNLINDRKNYLIYNIDFYSPMAATTKDKSITLDYFEKDQIIWTQYINGLNIMPIIEQQPKKKILIAIPTARYIEPDTFKSIYDLEIPDGYDTTFQCFYGYSVDQVRNLIADWTVNHFDYLFAVDHDVIFAPDTLKKLLSHDKPVVSGMYRQRLEPQTIEIYDMRLQHMTYDQLNNKGLIQIGGCGFGCVLVKKQVFVDVGYPQFLYHHAVNHANTFSEDLDFCSKASSKGHTIWADTSILCGHYGNKTYVIEADKTITGSKEENNLRKLSQSKLLPQEHIDYLNSMKNDLKLNFKVIYDIGACVLHWTNEAKQVWPKAEFIAFEAMDATKFLYEEAGIRYNLGPLGDKDNTVINFYENTEHPGGNSIYKENVEFSPAADILFPEEKKVRKILMTLDTIVQEQNFPLPDLIKMDVQGAELDILKGAQNTLKNCHHLILECQTVDYNKGAPKVTEIKEYLLSLGYNDISDMFSGGIIDGDYHFYRD